MLCVTAFGCGILVHVICGLIIKVGLWSDGMYLSNSVYQHLHWHCQHHNISTASHVALLSTLDVPGYQATYVPHASRSTFVYQQCEQRQDTVSVEKRYSSFQ